MRMRSSLAPSGKVRFPCGHLLREEHDEQTEIGGGWRRLQDAAGTLLAERVHLLAGEAHQQAVLRFVLRHVLDDVRDGLRHRDALDGSFPSELLGDCSLLLQVRGHYIHHGCLG